MNALWEEQMEAIDTSEMHWSTSTILAIFFASSLVSAVFFGLGYSFGRGGTSSSVASTGSSSPLAAAWERASSSSVQTKPGESTAHPVRLSPAVSTRHSAAIQHGRTSNSHVRTAVRLAPAVLHVKNVASADTHAIDYMVQVGAIRSRRDARTLVSELHRSGFHAAIYPGRHDRYLHVQIGPFRTSAEANLMRHRVLASGYRALLKHAS